MGAAISATVTSSNRVSASDGTVIGALVCDVGVDPGTVPVPLKSSASIDVSAGRDSSAAAEADAVLAGASSVLPNAGTELTGESVVRSAGGAVTTALGPAPASPLCPPAVGPS